LRRSDWRRQFPLAVEKVHRRALFCQELFFRA